MPRSRVLLLLVLLVAAVVRWVIALPALDRPLGGDAFGYSVIARNVAAGAGFAWGSGDEPRVPTAVRGPAYPLFLAGLERLFGPASLAAVFVAQGLLDLVSCLLVYGIARRARAGPAVALLAALLYALYIPFAVAASSVLTETFVNVTVLATLWFFLGFIAQGRRGDFVAMVLALGLAVLAKSHLVLLLPVLLLVALPELGGRRALLALVAGGAILALFVAPWAMRNTRVFGVFIPGTTHGGITFWGGTGPGPGGRTVGGAMDPSAPRHVVRATAGMNEIEQDRWFFAEGRRVIRENPARYIRVVAAKVPRLWLNLGFDDPPSRTSLAVALANLGLFALALLGARRLDPRTLPVRLLAALGIYFTLIHLPFAAVVRYAYPVIAFALVFAAAGLLPARLVGDGPATAAGGPAVGSRFPP